MATSNFWVKNAQSYYVFKDTCEYENEEGVMEEVPRDEWDWQSVMDDIRYYGKDGNIFTYESKGWNRTMDAEGICETETDWLTFGNGNAWTTETNVESFIYLRSGYYAGAVLDYDVKVTTSSVCPNTITWRT